MSEIKHGGSEGHELHRENPNWGKSREGIAKTLKGKPVAKKPMTPTEERELEDSGVLAPFNASDFD